MGGGSEEKRPQEEEVVASAAKSEEREDDVAGTEERGEVGADEEDTGAQIAPIVRLEEIAVSTGEENEEPLLDMKAKLYRFDQDAKQWKERGVGQLKLLRHKETQKVRLLMRQNKTLKICANHNLVSSMALQEHAGSDKSWVWHAMDYSDGEVKNELLCIRLGSVENAQKFKDIFEETVEADNASKPDANVADEAAGLLSDLKVSTDEKKDATVDSSVE